MGAGYDYEPIYEQVHRMEQQSVIAYNRRKERELIGFDKHLAPTCFRGHSYRYASFDSTYETLKYTQPKECVDCPLATDGICQKVYKIKSQQIPGNILHRLVAHRHGKTFSNAARLWNG